MGKQNVKISVTANLNYSGMVRHIANEVFESAKFSKPWCGRLKLVVDELFMNACRYGSIKDKSEIRLSFEYDEKGVKFTIEDDGTGPQAKTADALRAVIQQNEANSDLTRTSGRGLAMIAKMWTDGMEVAQSSLGGIMVSFVKKLETSVAPPQSPPMELMVPQIEAVSLTITPQPLKPAVPSPQAPMPAPQGPVIRAKLEGEIDQSNLAERIAPISQQVDTMPEGSVLELDFSELIYINSTFIGSLAGWYRILQQKGGRVRLIKPSPQIKEILTLVGLINVLEVQE